MELTPFNLPILPCVSGLFSTTILSSVFANSDANCAKVASSSSSGSGVSNSKSEIFSATIDTSKSYLLGDLNSDNGIKLGYYKDTSGTNVTTIGPSALKTLMETQVQSYMWEHNAGNARWTYNDLGFFYDDAHTYMYCERVRKSQNINNEDVINLQNRMNDELDSQLGNCILKLTMGDGKEKSVDEIIEMFERNRAFEMGEVLDLKEGILCCNHPKS